MARGKMANWRMRPEDEEIMKYLAAASGRGATFIIRKALRKVTVEDLMQPLVTVGQEAEDGKRNGSDDGGGERGEGSQAQA